MTAVKTVPADLREKQRANPAVYLDESRTSAGRAGTNPNPYAHRNARVCPSVPTSHSAAHHRDSYPRLPRRVPDFNHLSRGDAIRLSREGRT